MSGKPSYEEGIFVDADHGGLLCVEEERLIHIIKKEPISNVYHVEQTPFARGKFAAVRKCTHQQTGTAYAAKFIRKRRRAMDQRRDIIHEVAVLRLAADHQRIVRLHEVYETSAEMALVLELASGGELQQVLDIQDGLEETKAIELMYQILEGLCFLHDRNIAHLDLKPQNLLLTGEYPDCDVKLCDFGISRVIQPGIEVREILGTPDYVAPEILGYEPITLATDIWSVGVLAYVLLSGFSPFGGDTKQETFLNISQCSLTFPDELFSDVSSIAKSFIRATLQTEPKKRLTARQCLAHPWLATAPSAQTESISGQSRACGNKSSCADGSELNGVVVRMSQEFIIETDDRVVGCSEKIAVSVEMNNDVSHTNGIVDVSHQNGDPKSSGLEDIPVDAGMLHDSEFIKNVDVVNVDTCLNNEDFSIVDCNGMSQDIEPLQIISGHVEICTNGNHATVVQISQDSELIQNINSDLDICSSYDECPTVVRMSLDKDFNDAVDNVNGCVDCQSSKDEARMIVSMSQDVEYSETFQEVNGDLKCCTDYVERESIVELNKDIVESSGSHDRVNVHFECCKGYKERRNVVEMLQDNDDCSNGGASPESDEDLPVQKRPKNCCDGCCLSYPVAQCCKIHVSPEVVLRSSAEVVIHSSATKTTSDRSVMC